MCVCVQLTGFHISHAVEGGVSSSGGRGGQGECCREMMKQGEKVLLWPQVNKCCGAVEKLPRAESN